MPRELQRVRVISSVRARVYAPACVCMALARARGCSTFARVAAQRSERHDSPTRAFAWYVTVAHTSRLATSFVTIGDRSFGHGVSRAGSGRPGSRAVRADRVSLDLPVSRDRSRIIRRRFAARRPTKSRVARSSGVKSAAE